MATNNYPCSQEQLYLTAETAWNLYLINIGDFAQFRKAYTTQYYEENMQKIKAAVQMKSQRILKKELLLIKKKLLAAKKDVLHNYKCTVEFIEMYKGDSIIPLTNIGKHYRKASNNNWIECKYIAHQTSHYTNTYYQELTADNNMPEDFAKECKEMFESFEKLQISYELKKFDIKKETAFKIRASNTIYTNLSTMLRHAQLIYRKREDMQVLFQFDKLLRKTKQAKNNKGQKVISKPLGIFSKVMAMF